MCIYRSYVITLLLLVFGHIVMAQQVIIKGIVKDAQTNEAIPYAAVQFVNTNTGIATDDKGNYQFILNSYPADSLIVNVLGYEKLVVPVNTSVDTQTVNFELNRANFGLKEVVVHAGVNPALILLKKIIRHKPQNNYDRFDSYKYEVYNKLELDLDHIKKSKLENSKLLKPFAFIFNNIDSTSEDKPFLPVFLTETLSDYYYQAKPKKTKEIIKASRTSGIDNASLTKFLGSMYQNVNIYDNFIPVFDKKFVSPISDLGTIYYNYAIADTEFIDNRKCFKMTFAPRREGENVFYGDFWVNDTTYAIVQMNMAVPKIANINFVNKISLFQQFTPLGDTAWFLTKDKFIASFITATKKTMGFIGRKTTTYRDIVVNDTAATNIFEEKRFKANNIYVLDSARDKPESYWERHRHEKLSNDERSIYKMVDSLNNMPLFQKYSNIIKFIVTGTKDFGPLEYGPYYYIFSENHLEKYRFRLDLGTNTSFSKNLYLNGYLAYGTGDRQFKGKMAAFWILHRHPRTYLYGSYTHDLDNGALYYDEVSTDNIFTLAIRKPGVPQKFVMVDEKRGEFYKEWFSGFSEHLTLLNKQFSPYAPLPTVNYYENGKASHPLTTTELGLELRFAYREKFLEGDYYRFSLGSAYPIVSLQYTRGLKGILNSSYNYDKLRMSISDYIDIPPFGNLYYNFFGGKIFGTLPYLMLEVHPGNEIYYYDKYAFDMMNRYEYLSDQYAGFNIEHEIGSGIFAYIPGVRRLKLRQFWTAKGVIGKLSDANKALNLNNGYTFKTLEDKPYLELGTGVENILHFLRVDFIWRVAPKPLPNEPLQKRFGIFGSFKLQF